MSMKNDNIDDQLLKHDDDELSTLKQIANAANSSIINKQYQAPLSGLNNSLSQNLEIQLTKYNNNPANHHQQQHDPNLLTSTPPPKEFDSRDKLNQFIQYFAKEHGFGIVIAHSNKKAIYYTCELGGRYRHKKGMNYEQIETPQTKTKKLKCPFAMTANFKKSTEKWTLKTTNNQHNHPQLDPLSNHPMLRKRSSDLNKKILELYKEGTKPLHIEVKIRELFPKILIKREDIYNEIRGYKRRLRKLTGNPIEDEEAFQELETLNRAQQANHGPQLLDEQQQREVHEELERDEQRRLMMQQDLDLNRIGSSLKDEISIDNIDSRLVGESSIQ